MKQKAIIIGIFIFLVLICSECTRHSDFPVLKGPYLGQKPPGMTPEVFAPGIISTGYWEANAVFSPNGKELYYQLGGTPFPVILMMAEKDGRWTKPQVAPFSGHMFEGYDISPDGKRMFVTSDGKYFFFASSRTIHKEYSEIPITYEEKIRILNSPGNGNADIYWVDAKIIEELKPEELK